MVTRYLDLPVAQPGQQGQSHFLVDDVVLSEQEANGGVALGPSGRTGAQPG